MSEYPQRETEYYYDVLSNQVLIGAVALDAHIEAGGHPADISDLGEFIRDPDSEVLTPHYHRNEEWTKEACLEAGRWLLTILPEPKRPKEKKINETILRNAGRIGIAPGYRQISGPNLFGSWTDFYRHLGEVNSHRLSFDLTDEDLVNYVKQLIEERGRFPRADEIKELARNNAALPGYDSIYTRLGGILPAAQKAGFELPKQWSKFRYKQWGVEFYLANNLLFPTQKSMNMLSTADIAPAAANLKRLFGRDSNFRQQSMSDYHEASSQMEQTIRDGAVPKEIFRCATAPHLRAARYIRWQLIDGLVEDKASLKTAIVTADLPDKEFTRIIERITGLDEQGLKTAASEFGIFENLWRLDYLESLKIYRSIQWKLRDRSRFLSWTQKKLATKIVTVCYKSLRADGRTNLVSTRVKGLQASGQLPSDEVINDLFIDDNHLKWLLMSMVRNVNDSPKLMKSRHLARERLYRVHLLSPEHEKFIGSTGVKKVVKSESGETIHELEPYQSGSEPIPPGSAAASAIVERVRNDLAQDKTYTIKGTAGVRKRRDKSDDKTDYPDE